MVSRLIVVQSDGRVAQSLRYAFERDGAAVDLVPAPRERSGDGHLAGEVAELLARGGDRDSADPGGRVIIAGTDRGAPELLRDLRASVLAAGAEVPILYLGNGISRAAALEAGASEMLPRPAFLRDVVTMARLVAGGQRKDADTYRGELEQLGGAFHVLRAVCGIGCSAVLTMVRGLRRGEVRIYHGEVTSAQIGTLHGLPALRHLLLWHKANLELRFEDVVRRQQIPMPPDELLGDARQFLDGVAEVARDLDLGAVYQGVADRIRATRIPGPILAVLRLMDRSRAVPDVVEDSPYRTIDTLRVIQRLVELELVEPVEMPSTGFSLQLVGGLDEWLMSDGRPLPTAGSAAASTGDEDAEPGSPDESPEESASWSDVLPAPMNTEDASLAQVVPAASAAGEIVVAGRHATEPLRSGDPETPAGREPRDRLFALGDTSPLRADRLNRDHAGRSMQTEASDTSMDAEPRDAAESQAGAAPEDTAGQTGSEEQAPEDQDDPAGNDTGKDAQAAADSGDVAPEDQGDQAGSDTGEADQATADSGEAAPEDMSDKAGEAEAGEALAFTADEEAFFAEGAELASKASQPAESFADLDDGYQPPSFWDRLLGRKRRAAPPRRDARPSAKGPDRRKKRR